MVVTYSSINTNSFDGYGEMVMGSKGTMIVSQEKEILLYKEAGNAYSSRQTSVTVETAGKKPVLETSPSLAGPSAATALGGLATADPSRGYREELEHFAYCIRHGDAIELPRGQGTPAPLPRRGRPGRRRHRPDHQHRHASRTAGSSSTPSGSTTSPTRPPTARPRSCGEREHSGAFLFLVRCQHSSPTLPLEQRGRVGKPHTVTTVPVLFWLRSHVPFSESSANPHRRRGRKGLESNLDRASQLRGIALRLSSLTGEKNLMESQNDLGKELLWGLLACQNKVVSRDVLASALESWLTGDGQQPGLVFRSLLASDPDHIARIDSLTIEYLRARDSSHLPTLLTVELGVLLDELLEGVTDLTAREDIQVAARSLGLEMPAAGSLTVGVVPGNLTRLIAAGGAADWADTEGSRHPGRVGLDSTETENPEDHQSSLGVHGEGAGWDILDNGADCHPLSVG